MSEFSESYHLRSENIADGIALLQKIKVEGIVFPPQNGWVSLIVQGDLNDHIETIAAAWSKRIMHYMYAQDHAFMFNYFDKGDRVTGALATWDIDLVIDTEDLKHEILNLFISNEDEKLEMQTLFKLKEVRQVMDINMAYRFAQILKLPYYQNLGGGLMENSERIAQTLADFPEAEHVKL